MRFRPVNRRRQRATALPRIASCCLALAIAGGLGVSVARAQGDGAASELLLAAAEAMGGYERLQQLDNFVLTGFGQRYAANGALSADPQAPAKWQLVADAERFFDLRGWRALARERSDNMFPFAARFGHAMNRSSQLQTGIDMLDHPVPAVLAGLTQRVTFGPVRTEAGTAVVEFTVADGATLWIGIDPATSLPYWTRRITGDATLGDLTHTTWFTGYLPHDGVLLPTGIKSQIDWRDQTTLMFQVDSYQLNVGSLPAFPEPSPMPENDEPDVVTAAIAEGVWDVAVVRGSRRDGGAVVEFSDHLVMFEPYGSESETLARIDAANRLVPGKQVAAIIVSHHHADHAAGVRAAVARGIKIIGHARTRDLYEEWVARPAVLFPDALARNPLPLQFQAVDGHLVLEDAMRRLDVFHVVGHMHMSDALFAYLPDERILMEGDFTDNTWEFNWWAGAMQANIEHYGITPAIDIPVHGDVAPVAEKLRQTAEQVENARAFCAELEANGRFLLGCPVRYDTTGPLPLRD